MFTQYRYENTLTQGPTFYPTFYPNGNWLDGVEFSNQLFIGSEDDWDIFKGYLTANNITIKPDNWRVFPDLDSYVIKTYSTVRRSLFFYSRVDYVIEYIAKRNKEVTDDL